MNKVKLYLNYAGHCLAKEKHAIKGGRNKNISFQALWGLIEHPVLGWILYDTGYTERFYQATNKYPNKIYANLTKVKVSKEEEVVEQLKKMHISPEDIKHIIITHFHADHVGGLKDFPNATFYASKIALEHTIGLSSFFAFANGVLNDMLPPNLAERTVIIEEVGKAIDDPILGVKYDIFNDEFLYAVSLPGHAAGQIGIQLETTRKKYLLVADACWLKGSYEDMTLPNSIVKLFFHSWSDFKISLKKVHDFYRVHPEVIIVPTHCSTTTDVLVSNEISMDVL